MISHGVDYLAFSVIIKSYKNQIKYLILLLYSEFLFFRSASCKKKRSCGTTNENFEKPKIMGKCFIQNTYLNAQ